MGDGQKAQELMDKGFELLKEYNFDEAIAVGRRLKTMRHTSGFEILATAYHEKGEQKKAIRELEEGVSKAPKVWRLWQLLGSYYSYDRRFEQAHRAYQRALGCPECYPDNVHLNIAIALGREEHYEEALEALGRVTDKDEELQLRACSARLWLLNALGRHREAIQLARRVLPHGHDTLERPLAEVHAEYGHALLKETGDRAAALSEAWKAIELHANEGTAMWLVREIRNVRSPGARRFKIRLHGVWHEPKDPYVHNLEFCRSMDVVADTLEQALSYAKEFEPPKVRPSITLDDSEVLNDAPDCVHGVYFAAGHVYYSDDDEDSPTQAGPSPL